MELDYIIVGQGMAGSLLAHCLLRDGQRICVVDKPQKDSSSKTGAGIFNPITGRRIVKTWKADQLFPAAKDTYQELEDLLGVKFYHPKNMLRIFGSIKEQNDWLGRKEELKDFITQSFGPNNFAGIKDEFGSAETTGSGYLDIPVFLSAFRAYLKTKECLIEEELRKFELTEKGVEWKGLKAKRLIFCLGFAPNPWFKNLPFVASKGELLTVEIPELGEAHIIQSGIFILPLGDQRFRVGSTFDWEQLDSVPSPQAREELSSKLSKVTELPFQIIDHRAAVRPTVKDRRPLIGLHPKHPALGIFNGLGTKGVSLAPYFANQFSDFLQGNGALDEEVDISRFTL